MMKNQSGSVLAISLVLLTVITLIALMGLQRSGLQTRIVNNMQFKEVVFSNGESDINEAYRKILAGNTQDLSTAKDSPSQWVNINTEMSHNKHVSITTRLKHDWNGNALGNPNTSRTRTSNSRGKNGAGIENFTVATLASLPNDMRSGQKIGISINTPEQ